MNLKQVNTLETEHFFQSHLNLPTRQPYLSSSIFQFLHWPYLFSPLTLHLVSQNPLFQFSSRLSVNSAMHHLTWLTPMMFFFSARALSFLLSIAFLFSWSRFCSLLVLWGYSTGHNNLHCAYLVTDFSSFRMACSFLNPLTFMSLNLHRYLMMKQLTPTSAFTPTMRQASFF